MDETITVLTVDLPGDLSDRLRQALDSHPGKTLRDLTLQALEEWLLQDEKTRHNAA